QVVGHYALDRADMEHIAEATDALVLPEHRHHHLLEEMRLLLRVEAIRLGLTGMVGYPVTNHVYSQKAEEHFGSHPCGVALGLWPSTYHNMPEDLPQRMSFVIYYKYYRPPTGAVHVATHHHAVLSRISDQYGLGVRLVEAAPADGPGEIKIDYEPGVQAGVIRVLRSGSDTVAAISRARQELCE